MPRSPRPEHGGAQGGGDVIVVHELEGIPESGITGLSAGISSSARSTVEGRCSDSCR